MNPPTDSALKLAVEMSGHTSCIKRPCDLCVADAEHIDRSLLLPEKHAALLLAQGVADVWDRQCGRVFESMGNDNPRAEAIALAISDLRTALAKIR